MSTSTRDRLLARGQQGGVAAKIGPVVMVVVVALSVLPKLRVGELLVEELLEVDLDEDMANNIPTVSQRDWWRIVMKRDLCVCKAIIF